MSRTREASKSSFATGMRVLETLVASPRPLGLSQIAEQLEMPPSSTHDVLHLLKELKLVEQRSSTRAYTVTSNLLTFAHKLSLGYGLNPRIQEFLHTYAQEEYRNCCLCMLMGRESVITFASGHLCSTVVIGSHGPVYTTSAGKAIVSCLPEEDWPFFAPQEGDRIPTAQSLMGEASYMNEVREVAATGIAWNRQEAEEGLYSVAAPLRSRDGQVRHAVALMFSKKDWERLEPEEMEAEIRSLTKEVEALL